MKLYSRVLGSGPAFIIMHGVFGSSDNWLTIAKNFSEDYELHLLDLRNHGQSPHNPDFNYDVMSDDLFEYITDHSLVDPIVLGHSMGGKVAMQYAAKYQNYSKLIVVDISPRFYHRHHDDILAGLKGLPLSQLTTRQQADAALAPFVSDLGVRQFLLKNLYRNEQNEFAWRLNLEVIDQKIDAVGEALPEGIVIEKPTLFIKGSKSNYIQEKDLPIIKKTFLNYEMETIDGAGHWVQAEKPDDFIKLVRKFLNNER